ncbi:hypothetical protein VCHC41A1_1301, partial [Vibrio cholerae HC-41A1]
MDGSIQRIVKTSKTLHSGFVGCYFRFDKSKRVDI